ncbi:MAG: hypothetical protein P8Z37_19040 [Acidobacteriota bacterium]
MLCPLSFINVSHRVFSVLVLALMLGGGAIAQSKDDGADPPNQKIVRFADALKLGELTLNLRYRFEYVTDQTTASTGKNAMASTLRTAFSYRSRPFHGFAGFVEFENVSVPGKNLFNNKGADHLFNGMIDRPVVADPKLTEVNQVYLDLTALPDTVIRAGREEVVLDNHRFVGNVGWRQNHQSFDDVSIVNKSIPKTTLTYAHLFTVRLIFGDSKPMNSHLLNASFQVLDFVKLTAYAYLLDYNNQSDLGLTTNTFGFRISGTRSIRKEWKSFYDLEYMRQVDGGDNPNTINENYYRLEGGVERDNCLSLKVGHEVLGGSPEGGQFNTPLATLHIWNGWADKFLTTPMNGLKDTYFSLGNNTKRFNLSGAFHWFRSETGAVNYGKEMDLLAAYTSPWSQVFAIKTAFYRADSYSEDTDKIMLFTTYRF